MRAVDEKDVVFAQISEDLHVDALRALPDDMNLARQRLEQVAGIGLNRGNFGRSAVQRSGLRRDEGGISGADLDDPRRLEVSDHAMVEIGVVSDEFQSCAGESVIGAEISAKAPIFPSKFRKPLTEQGKLRLLLPIDSDLGRYVSPNSLESGIG